MKPHLLLPLLLLWLSPAIASRGDDLQEFKDCVSNCITTNCDSPTPTTIPLHLRLLLWTCPQECDYACQRLITSSRITSGLPVEQFHGKWPFRRLLGVQEPFSVLFSILNGLAHYRGLQSLRSELPRKYPLMTYYTWFSYIGMICWFFSALFHTRDFIATERLDYFGAGANVMYGLFYCPIRIFRLYRPSYRHLIKPWAYLCLACYLAHVYYLQFVTWDYTYNMAANVVVGSISNLLWTWFSIRQYGKMKKVWAAWPGLIVTWLILAMSLELLDFPPWGDALDAHALWHAMTILPAVWWYRFLVRDGRGNVEWGKA
ncbi:Per1-like protein [Pyronema domesticum]|uniref:Post-GPI attachment to proteins factor 3 n=1 Tax=Pyronema omphalodes (strain CBS 100304) TaxID=1076935 RepID=U4L4R3_PYROM|nr:Per1-like protein [Pyronema domesticum]CCX11513.1 Similar to Protein PER1 homolog; acc. no. Q9P6N9 [Pyronema omphalodes CBS 100304]